MQPAGTTVFFNLTLTVASTESDVCSRVTILVFCSYQSGQMRSEIILLVVYHQLFEVCV